MIGRKEKRHWCMALWSSQLPEEWKIRVRIPPGIKVFRVNVATLSGNIELMKDCLLDL
jgi:hypothetical protein